MVADARKTQTAFVPVPLVRYRFGAHANVSLHFHAAGGRTLFFYPAELPYRDGQWVFVQFQAAESQVPCLARGRVHAQRSGRPTGSWLEFSAAELPRVIEGLAESRRATERIPVDLVAQISRPQGRLLCRVSDVSTGGMRLSGLPCSLDVGERLSLELVGMPRGQLALGKARVVWVRMQEAGVQFDHERDSSAVRSVVEYATAAGANAIDSAHIESCGCRHGARPAEPPWPQKFRNAR